MIDLVVDSNILIALFDSSDVWHSKVVELQIQLESKKIRLHYLDCVMNEAFTVIGRRLIQKRRFNEVTTLFDDVSRIISHEKIDWCSVFLENWYQEILSLLKEHQGALSFNDAVISLYMKHNQMNYLWSFDQDFDKLAWIKRVYSTETLNVI